MRPGEFDQMVSDVIREGLGLTRAEEDALWGRFLARRAAEMEAWRAFASVMTLVTVGIRRATNRRAWLPLVTAMRYASSS